MKKLLILIVISSLSFAAPAYNGEIEFKQEDGSKFSGHLKGDEYFSWVEDKQGNIIKYNKASKNYEYAKIVGTKKSVDLVPSGVKVQNVSFGKSSFSSQASTSKQTLSDIWKRKKEERKYHH